MSGDLERRLRLLKLQKMKREKAKRELASTQQHLNVISSNFDAIISIIEQGSAVERLFPALTYDHLRSLDEKKQLLQQKVRKDINQSHAENKKYEKSLEAVVLVRREIQAEIEMLEQVELVDQKSAKTADDSASGKFSELDL